MLYVFTVRLAVQHGFSAYYYYALGVKLFGKLAPQYLGVAVGVFENVYFYKLPLFETVRKA